MLQEIFPRRFRHIYYVAISGILILVSAFFPTQKRGKKAVRNFEATLPISKSADTSSHRYNISLPPPLAMSNERPFSQPDLNYEFYAVQKDKEERPQND